MRLLKNPKNTSEINISEVILIPSILFMSLVVKFKVFLDFRVKPEVCYAK